MIKMHICCIKGDKEVVMGRYLISIKRHKSEIKGHIARNKGTFAGEVKHSIKKDIYTA